MQPDKAVLLIGQLLKECSHPMINDVTVDNDHKSAEIIVTTDDGDEKQDWVISSGNITEAARDYDEDNNEVEGESLTNVKRIFDEFGKLQTRWRDCGAGDTEPDTVFQYIIVDAINGKETKVPSDGTGWQLFSVLGMIEAAKQLKAKTDEMVAAISATPISERKALVAWAKDFCWRANHDLIS